MNTSHPKILAIIPTYNGEGFINGCLNSIVNGILKPDILVIDNASSDSTVAKIETTFEDVKLIKNLKNIGFGRAINLGFNFRIESGYDYLLIINQDAELKENTLEELIGFAKHLDVNEWAIISPWNLDTKGDTEYYFEDNLNKRSGNYSPKTIGEFEVIPVDFINAACWLVNAKALKKLKGFDKRFFMYGEDLDFCNRAKYFGYKLFVMKNVYCIHHKMKGDYEGSKRVAASLGSEMAYFLNPEISFYPKFGRFFRVNFSYFKLVILGNLTEGLQKIFKFNMMILKIFIFRWEGLRND